MSLSVLASSAPVTSRARKPALVGLGTTLLVLVALFSRPITWWGRFALESELYSYVLLVPFVSLYLISTQRRELAMAPFRRDTWPAAAAFVLGLIPLAGWWFAQASLDGALGAQDALFLLMSSFILLVIASSLFFLGRQAVSTIALPLGMLLLLIPLPLRVETGAEVFFQHTSAAFASWLFQISGTAFVRQGLLFHLPYITLEVARECSGIRSSLVLFVTSVVAGYLFLRSPWKRTILAAAVIPLAIARNGLRIFTVGMLCAHVDPAMIHSWVHLRGGPLFFAMSLVPFFGLLVLLRVSELRGCRIRKANTENRPPG